VRLLHSWAVLAISKSLDAAPQLFTNGADLQEMSDTNLPYLVNQSLLVQEKNKKYALPKLSKMQV
jgi:hypothetical protein